MGYIRRTREITKEIYDNRTPSGSINREDRTKVFTLGELCAYEIFDTFCYEKDGKYYVSYELGDSCD